MKDNNNNDNIDLSHLIINGYTYISQLSRVGRKGLVTYINAIIIYKTITHDNPSTNWVCQITEISGNTIIRKY